MVEFQFNAEKLQAVEKEAQGKFVSFPRQRQIMSLVSRAYREYLTLEGKIAHAFVTLALGDWQHAHGIGFMKVLDKPEETQREAVRELVDLTGKRLKDALAEPGNGDSFAEVPPKALAFVQEKFS